MPLSKKSSYKYYCTTQSAPHPQKKQTTATHPSYPPTCLELQKALITVPKMISTIPVLFMEVFTECIWVYRDKPISWGILLVAVTNVVLVFSTSNSTYTPSRQPSATLPLHFNCTLHRGSQCYTTICRSWGDTSRL